MQDMKLHGIVYARFYNKNL